MGYDDTYKFLEISAYFLQQYFHHSEKESEILTISFLENYSDKFDEDSIHHETAYPIAAIIHYLESLQLPLSEVGDWLLENSHNTPPGDALYYFRTHYFDCTT
ncbi:hypothetical protein FUAX_53610 (plasmid) [Fulvitalea axinellae]|uniref:Uncharacterized protein n=2 Tax=Fulvitalea axinellae TaxID=1182444 RepID=A0AAU9CLR7_9BACT|nr:hypothetical protein FUAX_53610 [Fulvitalea axinellae]